MNKEIKAGETLLRVRNKITGKEGYTPLEEVAEAIFRTILEVYAEKNHIQKCPGASNVEANGVTGSNTLSDISQQNKTHLKVSSARKSEDTNEDNYAASAASPILRNGVTKSGEMTAHLPTSVRDNSADFTFKEIFKFLEENGWERINVVEYSIQKKAKRETARIGNFGFFKLKKKGE